jgi:hypothetical protein
MVKKVLFKLADQAVLQGLREDYLPPRLGNDMDR